MRTEPYAGHRRHAYLLVGLYLAAAVLDAFVPGCKNKEDPCKPGYEYVLNSSYEGPRCIPEAKRHE